MFSNYIRISNYKEKNQGSLVPSTIEAILNGIYFMSSMIAHKLLWRMKFPSSPTKWMKPVPSLGKTPQDGSIARSAHTFTGDVRATAHHPARQADSSEGHGPSPVPCVLIIWLVYKCAQSTLDKADYRLNIRQNSAKLTCKNARIFVCVEEALRENHKHPGTMAPHTRSHTTSGSEQWPRLTKHVARSLSLSRQGWGMRLHIPHTALTHTHTHTHRGMFHGFILHSTALNCVWYLTECKKASQIFSMTHKFNITEN